MGSICGVFYATGERVDFATLCGLGRATKRKGDVSEAYLCGNLGLWHNSAEMLTTQTDGGNVSVLLATDEDEKIHPTAEGVLAAYLAYNLGFFLHLFGPYAVAIADERYGRVVLARDGSGRVPLSFAFAKNRLCFFSHADRLLGIGFEELPAGACLSFDKDGCDRLKRMRQGTFLKESPLDPKELP